MAQVSEQAGDAASSKTQHYGTGRRKTAVARVWIKAGAGQVTINDRPAEEYFSRFACHAALLQPLQVAELEGKIDLKATVRGGGEHGQAGAVRHGLSRALLSYDDALRAPLKKAGMLTRDSRIKERKKYGQPGARKRYQFSKR